jgi:hypothetical protein
MLRRDFEVETQAVRRNVATRDADEMKQDGQTPPEGGAFQKKPSHPFPHQMS